jgi:hypothetical protein
VRYPYERFLRFLVSRKVDVDKTIGKYGLPYVGALWVSDCRSDIRESAPFSVSRYVDASDREGLTARDGFIEWAESEGFRPLWDIQKEFGSNKPSAELDTAFQIFANPFARSLVGMMLLSQATKEEVADLAQSRLDLGIDVATLDLYTTIFWDGKFLGRQGWREFVGELKTKEERHYIGLGLSSPTTDKIRQFMGMNACTTPDEILQDIMSTAHAQYTSAMEQPNPEADGAIKWAELSIKAVNAIGMSKKAFGDLEGLPTGDFSQMFSVQVEKIQHVSLAELAGEVSPRDDDRKDSDKKVDEEE